MKHKYFLLYVPFVALVIALIVTATFQPTVRVSGQGEDETLTSINVEEAPTLDGVADEEFWATAPQLEIPVSRGANDFETNIYIQSVYTEDSVYFLATWEDTTESYLRAPWEMQADGTWVQLKDPENVGGDDNLWYEDKFSMIWNINDSIADFNEDGCFVACHRSEDSDDPKPYGNKFTENEGEMGDIWHWKSVRNLNQIHDQYLNSDEYTAENVNAGRHSDPADSGGYKDNVNEDKTGPAFMPAGDFPHDGAPGFILESEAVPFDASLFQPGDRIPSIIVSEFVGDGGDIAAGWQWSDGVWTLEFGRELVTGSEFDVQFEDLSATYYFGAAAFDNAQVRHAFQRGVNAFVFEQ